MAERQQELDSHISIPLYRVSAASKASPIDASFVKEELKQLERSVVWRTERSAMLNALRRSLDIVDYPYEELHGSRAYSREELRAFLMQLLVMAERSQVEGC